MQIYLAGGAVRDLLLGNTIIDRDYLVTGVTQREFEQKYPSAQLVGRAFPIYLIDKQEFSFPRGESINEELLSRDLTVNSLLLDENGDLYCHPKALEDLKSRTLRPASQQSFIDDPLRVFRAARFAARFPDFSIHPSLIDTMQQVAKEGLLDSVFADRIGQETVKALSAPCPGNYLRLLTESNCLAPWFTEFRTAEAIPAGPPAYHDSNVIEHTCRIMDKLAGNPLAAWMGLCHDLGKTQTPSSHLPKHHGHDHAGVTLAKNLAKRLRLSNAYVAGGSIASKWHMIGGQYTQLRPGNRVDLLMALHLSETFDAFFSLVEADQGTDYSEVAKRDLQTILATTLPPEWQNRGRESGIRLRELRAGKISKKPK